MSVSVSPPHVLPASFRFSLVCSSCPFIPQFKTPNSSKVQSASWNTPIHDMRPIQDVLGSTNTVLKAAMGKARLRQTETLEAFVPSWRCCSVKRGHRRAQHSSQHNYRHTIHQFSQTEQTAVFTVIGTQVYSCLLASCFAPSREALDALCWLWGFLGVCVISSTHCQSKLQAGVALALIWNHFEKDTFPWKD